MARSRIIKPGFFTNEDLADCGPYAQLLFAGLWVHCDREGRIEDRPRRLKALILPFYDVDVDELLQKLHDRGFIIRYSVDDGTSTVKNGSARDIEYAENVGHTDAPSTARRYIQVLNWRRHQSIHKHEPPSEIPPPFPAHTEPSHDGTSTDITESVHTSSPSLKRERERERERDRERGYGGERVTTPPPDTFIAIPLIDGSDFYVTRMMVDEWKSLYPAVDVEQKLREIRGWNLSHPRQRKTRRGVLAHITGWLQREQDRAPRRDQLSPPSAPRLGRIARAEIAFAAHKASQTNIGQEDSQ